MPTSARASIVALALVTIGLEVTWTRVLSAVLWYHFAFVVVSVAMLGVGLSGMIFALWPNLLEADPIKWMGTWALATVSSILASIVIVARVPFDPFHLSGEPVQLLWGALVCAGLALPFVFGGLAVGTILMNDNAQIGKIYSLDLVGAAVGAVVAPSLLRPLGGLGTLAAFGVIAGLVAISLNRGWMRLAAIFVTLPLLVGAITDERLFALRMTIDKPAKPNASTIMTQWSALARIDVFESKDGDRRIGIDGGTAMMGIPRSIESSGEPFCELPYALLERPRVLALGAGAGRDLAQAVNRGATEAIGIEVNPDIVEMTQPGGLADFGLHDDPRVTLVCDEARSYLARAKRQWDLIVSVHTISNAAFQSGSLAMAESYLSTAEAFDELFAHLSPNGVIYMTRPEAQMDRLLWTALDALRRRGHADPAGAVMVVRVPPPKSQSKSFIAGLLIAPRGLRTVDARALAAAHELELLAAPGLADGAYAQMLDWLEQPDAVPQSVRPVTDDRPYFNLRQHWWELSSEDVLVVLRKGKHGRGALENAPVGQVSLILVAGITVVVAGIATLMPIWLRRKTLLADLVSTASVFVVFSLLGAGFMLVELGLIHALTLFVGPPTIAVAAVLCGLLLGAGLGSRWSEEMPADTNGPARALAAVIAAIPIFVLMDFVLAWPLPARMFACTAMTTLVGVPLGLAFPLALRRCRNHARASMGLAWGVMGFSSVLGGVAAALVSTSLGFRVVLGMAVVSYGLAALVWRVWGRRYSAP